jgi:hypothetical protein
MQTIYSLLYPFVCTFDFVVINTASKRVKHRVLLGIKDYGSRNRKGLSLQRHKTSKRESKRCKDFN